MQLIDEQPKVGEWITFTKDNEGILDCETPDTVEFILVSDGVNVTIDLFVNDGKESYLQNWNRDLIGLAWQPLLEPWEGDLK